MPCLPPYRLDLTVAALRRTPANPVDVLEPDGRYLRAFVGPAGNRVCVALQPPGEDALHVAIYRSSSIDPLEPLGSDIEAAIPLVLGAGVDLSGFYAVAAGIPGLAPLVEQARGVKPPRYPSLWEALCNAVVFQQVSIEAAMAAMRWLIGHCSTPRQFGDTRLFPFPSPEPVARARPEVLRSLGLSATKVRTLQEAARLLLAGDLAAEQVEALPTPDAMARLEMLYGIGPWTAAVIMLRGFGRLDVFPAGDSGARRNMRGLLGDSAGEDGEGESILAALGPWRGMLYYHLLLWRLANRGIVAF